MAAFVVVTPFFDSKFFSFFKGVKLMAYALDNPIHRVGPQNSNGPTLWTYADGDALTVIDGADYFLLDVDKL